MLGDECHIISPKSNGPRHIKLDETSYDHVDNLILLCKIHHKLVDDQVELFPADGLRNVKQSHETWVDQSLKQNSERASAPHVRFLKRVTNGTDLAKLIGSCHAYLLDSEPPKSEAEAEVIGYFHQDVFDWGEIWSNMMPSERVRVGFSLNAHFSELERYGLWVFASIVRYKTKYANGGSSIWPTLVLTVVRPTNPGITPLGELATVLAPTTI